MTCDAIASENTVVLAPARNNLSPGPRLVFFAIISPWAMVISAPTLYQSAANWLAPGQNAKNPALPPHKINHTKMNLVLTYSGMRANSIHNPPIMSQAKPKTLKSLAEDLNTKLPRYGDITTTIDGHKVICWLGSLWTRPRRLQDIRVFPLRGTPATMASSVTVARDVARRTGIAVGVEAGRMLIAVQPSGSISRHPTHYVVRPAGPLP